jgi:hypothetical protein
MAADLPAGLSLVETAQLLATHGRNVPAETQRLSHAGALISLFANPLVLILLAAA